MRVSRLYVVNELASGQSITLQEEAAHYLRTVLRLKKGQELVLFNGRGGEFSSVLVEVSKKKVIAAVQEYSERTAESVLSVALGVGISRGDRMDWAMQKAVELGAVRITPLQMERCLVKFTGDDKKQLRLQHWRHIVQHAAEQSGRTRLAEIDGIESLPGWVARQEGLKLFCDPSAERSLADVQPENNMVTLLSGPEGGFTARERESAQEAGFVPIRLGPRILRTETAVLTALSAVQTLWGDFTL